MIILCTYHAKPPTPQAERTHNIIHRPPKNWRSSWLENILYWATHRFHNHTDPRGPTYVSCTVRGKLKVPLDSTTFYVPCEGPHSKSRTTSNIIHRPQNNEGLLDSTIFYTGRRTDFTIISTHERLLMSLFAKKWRSLLTKQCSMYHAKPPLHKPNDSRQKWRSLLADNAEGIAWIDRATLC